MHNSMNYLISTIVLPPSSLTLNLSLQSDQSVTPLTTHTHRVERLETLHLPHLTPATHIV